MSERVFVQSDHADRPGLPAHLRQAGYRRNGAGKHGWDYCHVAVDDTSRLAYVEILDNETGVTCIGFLRRAVAWFATQGITVQRVMTDNGPGYKSKIHAQAIAELEIKHLRTRPYRPRTNGKAERFIKTLQMEWAYAANYQNHHRRAVALEPWITYYNWRRPHSALGHKPPASRLTRTDERSWDLQVAPTRQGVTAAERAIGRVKLKSRLSPSNAPEPSFCRGWE